jgi:hypothetical protein
MSKHVRTPENNCSVRLPARQEAVTRFWDHNFNEVTPPAGFEYISVDCAGIRWSGIVTGCEKTADG